MIGKPGAGGKRQIICPLKISAKGDKINNRQPCRGGAAGDFV
jgi:hypothetical protein